MIKNKTIKLDDGSLGILIEDNDKKYFVSKNYNYLFKKKNGYFARWGRKLTDDGDLNIGLPEIADIEISTICSGVKGEGVCKFCYKSNTPKGKYMSLDTFKSIFIKLPPTITQIAFGIGDILGNPDMWDIFDYTRKNGVIPNVTINGEGVTNDIAKKLFNKCGAVAVSYYNREKTYNTIKKLTDLGMEQVNIHAFLADETYSKLDGLLNDVINKEPRLKKLNAIVFLSLKKQGRAKTGFNRVTDEHFDNLVNKAMKYNISIGFDSCTAHKFMKWSENNLDIKSKQYKSIQESIEPCESSIYSAYINVDGHYFPCSFIENTKGWEKGIDILSSNDFLEDIWQNNKTKSFRKKVINCRKKHIGCPVYKI